MKSACVLAVLASVVCAGALFAEPIVGHVDGVADGDTITVLDALKHQHKIRLSGIDAPEGGQAFGQRSKQTLSDWRAGGQQAHAAAKESSGECDCSTGKTCTGKRGGSYGLTDTGAKQYAPKE